MNLICAKCDQAYSLDPKQQAPICPYCGSKSYWAMESEPVAQTLSQEQGDRLMTELQKEIIAYIAKHGFVPFLKMVQDACKQEVDSWDTKYLDLEKITKILEGD